MLCQIVLYDSGKNLIHTSDYIDNFITNTGVWYPQHFAFADCFRYLSLGVGTGVNSILQNNISFPETTGLQSPLTGIYAYVGGRNVFMANPTPTNYAQGCGYRETASGIDLFRQWSFPDNTGGLFNAAHTFNEFMVTPGQPYITGNNGIKLCTCGDADGYGNFGNDCSATAMYYSWVNSLYAQQGLFRAKMCDATLAFARIVYPINVVPDSTLYITYRLSVIPNTGLTFSSLNNLNMAGAVSTNWSGLLNAVSTITQPGIKLINDGTITNGGAPTAPNGNSRTQQFGYGAILDYSQYDFPSEYGESFVPPMGIPLEPSNVFTTTNQNVVFYLASDNTEFLVGPSGYLYNTGNFAPWQQSSGAINVLHSGLAPYLNNNSEIIAQGATYWTQSPPEQ